MRKVIVLLLVTLLLAMAIATPVLAHNAGPCNDSGGPGHSDYARHHIVPADLGAGGHVPGTHHGFSVCIPTP